VKILISRNGDTSHFPVLEGETVEQAIQLFGYLIITFLGVLAPILVILLSMFREGVLKLTTQYESERSQSEGNIKKQLKKLGDAEKTDVEKIEHSLNELKVIKKTAQTKLSYLDPKMQILRLFMPLLISFLGVIFAILTQVNIYYVGLSIAVSLICFTYVMVVLWKLLGIMIEVRKTIDDDKKDMDTKTIELLSALVEKESQYFLKAVYVTIDDKNIKDNAGEIRISADIKQELKIGIRNSETRMAKSVEIGFIFPPDFIIEKTNYYSIYNDKTSQIVRYETSLIHGKTHWELNPLIITPLKEGDYKIQTFIKAENIESVNRNLNLKVTKSPFPGDIIADLLGQQKGEQ